MAPRLWRFDLPLALLGVATMWGAAVAYDRTAADARLPWLAAGFTLYAVASLIPDRVVWRGRSVSLRAMLVGGLSTGVAAWFLVSFDWSRLADKVVWLDSLQQWIADHGATGTPMAMHPNVAGGVLACLLPLHATAVWSTAGRSRVGRLLAWASLALATFATLMSRLRGGWLALIAACLVLVWWRACRASSVRSSLGRIIVCGAPAAVIVLAAAFVATAGDGLPRQDRWQIWVNSWFLARDYTFTGLGLGGFPMAYSSYALLVHVPHTMHAHNLFLDAWLELGLAGLGAMLWVAWSGLSPGRQAPPCAWDTAARVSWLVTLVLGLIDDVHFGYGGAGAGLLLVPLGLRAAIAGESATAPRPESTIPASRWRAHWVAALACLSVLALPQMRAAAQTSRAALEQTRAELAVYRWPAWPVQDALRRSRANVLGPVIAQYERALAVAPDAGAAMRLGQIELSMGRYEAARTHLAAAWAATPSRPAVRQLYGESLAVTGDVEGAARVWRHVSNEVDQLAIREGWYRLLGDGQREAWIRDATARAHAR